MNISVVGTGYVGLVTAACFAEFGVQVVAVDKDVAKVALLQQGNVPFFEPGLEEMTRRNMREGRLVFSTDLKAAVEKSLVILIAVGTPSGDGGVADLSFVREVIVGIARCMNGYKVVVTKSTVPMGTGAMIRKLIEQSQPRSVPFSVASNPEFLREGAAIEDFMRPNRVVIGADDPQAIAILRDLYNPLYLIETPFVITNVVSAEMIKYASNAFLATKISFINEIAALCEAVGADVHEVSRGMGLDNRIGTGGSSVYKEFLAIERDLRPLALRISLGLNCEDPMTAENNVIDVEAWTADIVKHDRSLGSNLVEHFCDYKLPISTLSQLPQFSLRTNQPRNAPKSH